MPLEAFDCDGNGLSPWASCLDINNIMPDVIMFAFQYKYPYLSIFSAPASLKLSLFYSILLMRVMTYVFIDFAA